MLRTRLAFAALATLLPLPALAIDEPPDESAEATSETDSYLPNRFSIALHGEWVNFRQDRDVQNTGSYGVRIGYRIARFAELQFGVSYLKTDLEVESESDGFTADAGNVRIMPYTLDLRIDVTEIDAAIPWPLDWCRPELILGAGYVHMRVNEEGDSPLELSSNSGGLVLRGGLGILLGPRDARVHFGVEWVYNYMDNDIKVSSIGDYPSRLNLDYWTLGAFLTFRF